MMIEVCAGMLDQDNAEQCVIRETEEETGYRLTTVHKWKPICLRRRNWNFILIRWWIWRIHESKWRRSSMKRKYRCDGNVLWRSLCDDCV
jgi:8-oxo-dGTP pyrophosphatase MutT (NUDIX family)